MMGALECGLRLGNPVLIDTALTLGIAACMLTGVAWAQRSRLQPLKAAIEEVVPEAAPEPVAPVEGVIALEGIRTWATARLTKSRGS